MINRLLAVMVIVFLAGATGWLAWRVSKPDLIPRGVQADRIVVYKAQRQLTLLRDGKPLKTYRIALGTGAPGHKQRQGDKKTPEGLYRISGRNAQSCCHLALRISYPEPRDIAAAKARGDNPGGDIMIHGFPNGWRNVGRLHRLYDWTHGCIGVTNDEIEELWRVVPDGTPIEILP